VIEGELFLLLEDASAADESIARLETELYAQRRQGGQFRDKVARLETELGSLRAIHHATRTAPAVDMFAWQESRDLLLAAGDLLASHRISLAAADARAEAARVGLLRACASRANIRERLAARGAVVIGSFGDDDHAARGTRPPTTD
jgi:hypothetical protein